MIPAAAPQPVPVARLRLRRVQVRGLQPTGAPVFHVFQELFERAVEHRAQPSGPKSAARS